jgi:hypothetical protein
MFQQAAQAIASGPRTVLGFCVAVFGIVVAGSFAVVIPLARYGDLRYLIGWILGFDGALTVLMLATVFLIVWKDPMRLMLGQITGSEFIQHRRLVMGDSTAGEEPETILVQLPKVNAGEQERADETDHGKSGADEATG